jgi:hypothetical protein
MFIMSFSEGGKDGFWGKVSDNRGLEGSEQLSGRVHWQ